MKLMQLIRKLFLKPQVSQHYEYVRETSPEQPSGVRSSLDSPATVGAELRAPAAERAEEIAFGHQGDLESYVHGLELPKEAIERWISAGVLSPEETKVASQMIRIIRKKQIDDK